MNSDTWYYHKNLKPLGPVTREKMQLLIRQGEVGPSDLICNENTGQWRPAVEWGVFELQNFPAEQLCRETLNQVQDEKVWVVLFSGENGSILQEGPFSIDEIRQSLKENQIFSTQYVWKPGLSGWCRIKDRIEFSEFCQ